jgi:hypothetical protein
MVFRRAFSSSNDNAVRSRSLGLLSAGRRAREALGSLQPPPETDQGYRAAPFRLLQAASGGGPFPKNLPSPLDPPGYSGLRGEGSIPVPLPPPERPAAPVPFLKLTDANWRPLASELIGEQYLRLDTNFERAIELDDCRNEVIEQLRSRAEYVVSERWMSDARRIAALVR